MSGEQRRLNGHRQALRALLFSSANTVIGRGDEAHLADIVNLSGDGAAVAANMIHSGEVSPHRLRAACLTLLETIAACEQVAIANGGAE